MITYLSSAELYDPASGTWTTTGSLSDARERFAASLMPNGKVLAIAGDNLSAYLSSAEIYDPATGSWSPASSLNVARNHHAAVLLRNGNVLVEGGQNPSGWVSSTETYTSSNLTVVPIKLTGAAKQAGGAFQFSLTNTPDISFLVYSSTNAAAPISNWTVITGLTEVSAGHYQVTDAQAAAILKRYYRVRSP